MDLVPVSVAFQDVFVVALDDTFDVFGAAVAYFNGIAIEDLVEFVVFREVLVDKLQKSSGNFRLDVFVIWWVEPCDVTFTIFWLCVLWVGWLVRKFYVVAAFFQRLLIRFFGFGEDMFVG